MIPFILSISRAQGVSHPPWMRHRDEDSLAGVINDDGAHSAIGGGGSVECQRLRKVSS